VACNPFAGVTFVPNGGVEGLAADLVTTDVVQMIALSVVGVKSGLIFIA
jgi:hypothetical protein